MVMKALNSGASPRGSWVSFGVESGTVELVEYLIALMDECEIEYDLDLCLLSAASRGDVALLRKFVSLVTSVSPVTYRLAVESAAQSGVVDAFVFVFDDGNIDLGFSLKLAASLGHSSIVHWIVDNTTIDDEWICIAAGAARETGMNDIVSYLMKKTKQTLLTCGIQTTADYM